jgi:hypothetical protein
VLGDLTLRCELCVGDLDGLAEDAFVAAQIGRGNRDVAVSRPSEWCRATNGAKAHGAL